jgi:hypothetical protein
VDLKETELEVVDGTDVAQDWPVAGCNELRGFRKGREFLDEQSYSFLKFLQKKVDLHHK